MLKKTKGIVINHLKYRDTSIITKIFTKELGLKSYLVNGVRSSKSKPKMALYQPLTLLELVVYDRENRNLHHIAEAKLEHAFLRIPFDFYRSGIALFMAEILGKVLPDGYQNEGLFGFLEDAIIQLDTENTSLGTYPLAFLLLMTRYLGFEPEDAAHFYDQLPTSRVSQNHRLKVSTMDQLIQQGNTAPGSIPTLLRRELMEDLILFYQTHLDGFGEVRSLEVLRSLM